jgi:hypothetical protein
LLIFGFIAGLLSALGWSVVAIARWAGNRPRGQHWNPRGWFFTTGGLTLAMLLLTISLSSDREQRQGRSPAPIVSSISATERLPSGVVELVALSSHPSDGTWWKPDGSLWTGEPFTNPGHSATSDGNRRGVEMVIRMPGVNAPNPSYKFELAGSMGSSGGSMAIQNGEQIKNSYYISALFPKDLTETTIGVGVAHGEWETIADEESGSQANLSIVRHGKPISMKFVSAIENKDGDTVLTMAHDIEHAEIQLVAVDNDGIEQRSVESNTSRGHVTATFKDRALENIKRFRLKTRPYRWAIFENVQLEPQKGGLDSGVRVSFEDVRLDESDGVRRLELHYTLDRKEAALGWNTDGRFEDAAVDLTEGTAVVEGARVDEPASYRHSVSLALPRDLDSSNVTSTLSKARARWNGNSLVVYPGDKFPIVTINQRPGNEVTLSIVRRPAKED